MNREQKRLVLLGLSDSSDAIDRREAMRVMIEQVAPPDLMTRDLQIPLAECRYVTVRMRHPLSPDDWAHLLTVLEAMRPGLVREVDAAADADTDIHDLTETKDTASVSTSSTRSRRWSTSRTGPGWSWRSLRSPTRFRHDYRRPEVPGAW